MKKFEVQKMGSIFFYSADIGRFDFGINHPFKPERLIKTYELCDRYGVINYLWMDVRKPEPLDSSLLYLFHEPGYIDLLKKASMGDVSLEMLGRGLGTDDTPILKGIYEWSLQAAGGSYMAIESLINGKAQVAFNLSGGFHHAMPGNAEGFCYINDIVIAIKSALNDSPGLRVAYIDIDAHHGNGVQHAFYNTPEVLFISLHETGKELYPWSGFETETGEGDGEGFTINIPLEPGTDDEVYDLVFKNGVLPVLEAFGPDLAVIELGADTLISDPLTHLKLTNNGYQEAVKGVRDICPKILGLGGGGYDIFRTSRCWTLAWALMNYVDPVDEFAGLVGGMMFGPEMEVGSLYDNPYKTKGEIKEKALDEARRVLSYIKKNIFPIHHL
ncbi:MAG: acetoin utilization protein AcuC [Deltaproteobacteria bacterium]|nr:acetoin utilization protein AcuC [Deltaproteobacteria bacterium]